MDIFKLLVVFCLLSATITYGLGIYVFAKNSRSYVNRLFCLVMLGASYWAVGEFLIWQVNSYENVFFWLKFSSFWTLVIIICVHFIIGFVNHPYTARENFWKLILYLYLPGFIFGLIGIFTEEIFTVSYAPGFGYYYEPTFDSLLYLVATVYFLIVMFWGFYVGFAYRIKTGPEKIRHHSNILSIGILIVIGLGSQSVIFLPRFGIYYPNLVFIGIVAFSLIIFYAIHQYGLFTLSPETAASHLIQIMPDGLILTTMDGTIITINETAAHYCLKKSNNYVGHNIDDIIPKTVYIELKEKIERLGQISDYEILPGEMNGTVLSVSGSIVSDPNREPAGLIFILRDITTRKISERALKLAHEKISLLTQLTRHDISNLVTALDGYLCLLKEDNRELQCEKMIETCIDLVQKITNQLHFSRQYQDIGTLEPIWQSLSKIVEIAVRDISHDEIEITSSIHHVQVFSDPLMVKVIYNLLDNAVRHGNGLSKISIRSHINENNELIVQIEDDGEGIPNDEKEIIFTHGFGKNTGLGLTISREILSVTNITIRENGVPGIGARFEIIIPPFSWRNYLDNVEDRSQTER